MLNDACPIHASLWIHELKESCLAVAILRLESRRCGVMARKTVTKLVLCHPHVVHSAARERSLTLALSGLEGQV